MMPLFPVMAGWVDSRKPTDKALVIRALDLSE
jgi:hypothetical protein